MNYPFKVVLPPIGPTLIIVNCGSGPKSIYAGSFTVYSYKCLFVQLQTSSDKLQPSINLEVAWTK